MPTVESFKEWLTEIIRPIIFEAVDAAYIEKKANPPKRYFTPDEAQKQLKISRATFYRLVGKGKIQILKIGNKSLIDADALEKSIQKREIYRYKHY